MAVGAPAHVRAGTPSTLGTRPAAVVTGTFTATCTQRSRVAGIQAATFALTYPCTHDYASRKVVADSRYRASFAGVAGVVVPADSVTRWVSGDRGHCVAVVGGGSFRKGSPISHDEETGMSVAAPGNTTGYIRSI